MSEIANYTNGTTVKEIAGYTYGTSAVAPSPITTADLDKLKTTVLFGEEDERYLRLAGEVLGDQVEEILDLWYGFVGSHGHLLAYFSDAGGNPQPDYLASVRRRFGQWIRDTCARPYDQAWLDYQHEIALRHFTTKKNQTDGADSVPIIHARYLITFIYPITATIRPFLAAKGHSDEAVEKMFQAWFKAVTLTATLWCVPYMKDGAF